MERTSLGDLGRFVLSVLRTFRDPPSGAQSAQLRLLRRALSELKRQLPPDIHARLGSESDHVVLRMWRWRSLHFERHVFVGNDWHDQLRDLLICVQLFMVDATGIAWPLQTRFAEDDTPFPDVRISSDERAIVAAYAFGGTTALSIRLPR